MINVVGAVGSASNESHSIQGTVKWFNGSKDYGFVQPDDGGEDILVRTGAVEHADCICSMRGRQSLSRSSPIEGRGNSRRKICILRYCEVRCVTTRRGDLPLCRSNSEIFCWRSIDLDLYYGSGLRLAREGRPGLEIWGLRETRAGDQGDHHRGGEGVWPQAGVPRAYSTVEIEADWNPSPMPAIYSRDKLKPHREWLRRDRLRTRCLPRGQLGLRRHRSLLPYAVGPGLRRLREVQSRSHRSQCVGTFR
jgi:cold shock CspA family protein